MGIFAFIPTLYDLREENCMYVLFVPDIFTFTLSNKFKKVRAFHPQFVICSYFACHCLR